MLKKNSLEPLIPHVSPNTSKPGLTPHARFGVFFWVVLHLLVLLYQWNSLSKSSTDFLYVAYEPMVPILGMLWLWGLNIHSFTKAGIRYEQLFEPDDQAHMLHSGQLFEIAGVITAMVTASAAYCANALAAEEYRLAAVLPLMLYICCGVFVMCPVNFLHRQARCFFSETLLRVFIPIATVSFSDFILADILTSLAKALSDSQHALCVLSSRDLISSLAGGTFRDRHAFCGRGSWHVNLAVALPYLIRLCQCVSTHRTTGDKSQLFNALKYSTALPVIALSYARYHSADTSRIELWILASVMQTVYCVYWDIEKDWDIKWFSHFPCGFGCLKLPALKSDLLYPRPFYFWAMGSNIVARALWIYKLSLHLKFSKTLHFVVSFIEVLRRHQWVFIRFESGLRKKNIRNYENGIDA